MTVYVEFSNIQLVGANGCSQNIEHNRREMRLYRDTNSSIHNIVYVTSGSQFNHW